MTLNPHSMRWLLSPNSVKESYIFWLSLSFVGFFFPDISTLSGSLKL